jgi:uncharacterized integral membrane protein
MVVGAGLLYLAWLLVTANADPVKVDFLIGRVELAVWQAMGLAFATGALLVALYTLYQMARGGLVRRRYRKQLAGLETEVHQLRNLPLHEGDASEAPGPVFDDDLEFAPEGGGAEGR